MTTPSQTPESTRELAARPSRKPLQTFLLHAAFLTLLFSFLPSLDSAYAYLFKAAGNAAFSSFGSDLSVEYAWVPLADRKDRAGEIEMIGRSERVDRPVWQTSYSVRDRGYLPTATLLALILATPATRRRMVIAALGGSVVLNLFFLSQTGVLAASAFATANSEFVLFGNLLAAGLPTTKALFGSPIVRYAAVFAIWAATARPAQGVDFSRVTGFLKGTLGAPGARKP